MSHPREELRNPIRPAGMREVAEQAGVAISSVSRVLSGHPDVSVVMRDRVLRAVSTLGYEPDLLAQGLRTGATMTVGLIATDIGNPLFAEIAQGAETTLRGRGYSMLLANAFNDVALTVAQLRSMQQRRIDGLLISVSDETDAETSELMSRCSFPIIMLDREMANLPAVLSDHESGIVAAVEHLRQLGHLTITLVNGPSRVRPSRERARAIRRLARRHPDMAIKVRMGSFSAEFGERITREIMRAADRPTAVIAGSNQILIGVLRALRDLQLSIPEDVSVVTCDDVAMAEFLSPPLTTISRDARALGDAAASMLLDALAGHDQRSVSLPTGFRATDSCAPPASLRSAHHQQKDRS